MKILHQDNCMKLSGINKNSKKIQLLLCFLCFIYLFIISNSAIAQPSCGYGGSEDSGLLPLGVDRTTYYFVPPAYTPDKPAPLIIVLHGTVDVGNALLNMFSDIIGQEKDDLWKRTIVVAPKSPTGIWHESQNYEINSKHIDAILKKVTKDFNIDLNRVIIAGWSTGAVFLGDYIIYHPDVYSAAVYVEGGGYWGPQKPPASKYKIANRFIIGSKDFMYKQTYQHYQWLKNNKFPVSWDVISNKSHSEAVYDKGWETWEWIKKQVRTPNSNADCNSIKKCSPVELVKKFLDYRFYPYNPDTVQNIEDLNITVSEKGLKRLIPLTKLKKISLEIKNLDEEIIADLKNFPDLKTLELSIDFKKELNLSLLKELPSLDSLIIALNPSDNDAAKNTINQNVNILLGMRNIKNLEIFSLALDDSCFSNLKNAQHLQSLGIRGYITDGVLKYIKDLNNLKSLLLQGDISNQELINLTNLPNLAQLTISNDSFPDEGLKYIKKLTNLKELNIQSYAITDNGLKDIFPDLTNLEKLALRSHVTGAFINSLKNSPNLKTLEICSQNLTDESLKGIENIKGLEELKLETGTSFTDKGLNYIKNSGDIRKLYIEGNITDNGLNMLKRMKNLQSLSLHSNTISDNGLKYVGELTSLNYLSLELSEWITDKGLKNLKALKSLQYLDLMGTKVTGAGISELKKVLKNNLINY